MEQELSGIIVPILTPLDAQENVDEARLRRQVDFVIEGGVNGILLFGSNGEFYMTEEDEMAHCLDVVLGQTAGRVPVYFGIGAIRTGKCIRLAKMAQDHGDLRFAADVPQADGGRALSAFPQHCRERAGAADAAL